MAAVGIDLGTSYSCIAMMRDGKPVVLTDERGKKTHPSVVAFGFDGNYVVGWKAQRQLIYAAESTVNSPKRLIGRRYGSQEVKRLMENVGYEITRSATGGVLVKVRNKEYTLPQISGMILKHMKDIAEQATGEVVDQAVITVPAYFNDHQRQATREAAREAGLTCLRIINEPTAAALAYGTQNKLSRNIAIYDLGGGTFDVTILKLEDDVYEVLGTSGDTFLGGDDFDAEVAKHFLKDFKRNPKVQIQDNRVSWMRIINSAERAKIALGDAIEVEVTVPGIAKDATGAEVNVSTRIDRFNYAQLVMPLVQRTFQVCDEAIRLAGLSVSQIDHVLLVGGMAKLFLIPEAVEQYFLKPASSSINPHEVVAMGAAIQAHNLSAEVEDAGTSALLLDVTPRSLGIATKGGFVQVLIPRNSTIPTEQSKWFYTAVDNQTQVRIAVYQGESQRTDLNQLLGEFVLDGLRAAPRGEIKVKITFQIDADGIVHVVAEDPETKSKKELRISMGQE